MHYRGTPSRWKKKKKKDIPQWKWLYLRNKAFSRTKRAKQSQRGSVLRTASNPNITVAILQGTTHVYTLPHKQYMRVVAHKRTLNISQVKAFIPLCWSLGRCVHPSKQSMISLPPARSGYVWAHGACVLGHTYLFECVCVCVCVCVCLCRRANTALGTINARQRGGCMMLEPSNSNRSETMKT